MHKSAVITIATLDLYLNVRAHGGGADPLRVIQGLAQAIGFIAAGGIFVDRGRVRNLTTAANVWLTAGVGIAASSILCATGALFTDRDLKLSINFMPNAVYEPSACIQKSLAAAKRANFPSFRNRAVTGPTSNTGTL